MSNEDWRPQFKRLWTELVPSEGQASTTQGELIRAVGKLKDEAFRNGNQNFGNGHRILCHYVSETMLDSNVFSRTEIEEIKSSIERVLDSAHPDVLGDKTCFHYLFEMSVRWCQAHPNLIPHHQNSALKI